MRRRIGLLVICLCVPAWVVAGERPLNSEEAQSQLSQIELAISAGRVTQAGSMLQAIQERLPAEYQVRRSLLLAEMHMATGDNKAASQALVDVPANISDQCRYGGIAGWLAYLNRNWNEAISMLAKSVDACPNDPGRWNLLGLSLVQKGEMAAALEAFDLAVAQAPNNPSLLNNRALAYAYAGKTDAALADLERAASVDDDIAIMANLSALRANAGLEAPLEPSQNSQTRTLILAKAGDGASAAERNDAARSYYAQAILQSERFDNELWTRATSHASEPETVSEDRNIIP